MERKQLKRLPIGMQTFSEIRETNCLYIDKTEYIWRMKELSNYIFLSRPRRFGKSLLVSTIQAYFEGRQELFEGLAIGQLEKEWKEYPVLRFDLSLGKHMDKSQLERLLIFIIEENEKRFGLKSDHIDPNVRLMNLITRVYEQTGHQVVVLIDEYDAPMLDVVHEDEKMPQLRQVMRNFYSPLKACDPFLKFVFITGITKFSQLSIFSELNNLKNISMLPEYATLCGISENEMVSQMADYIDRFALRQHITHEETVGLLKKQYDGYHFTWPSPGIFNPFSLLNAMQDCELNSYWFTSGTPSYLIEMMRKFNVMPSDICTMEGSADDFDAPTETMTTLLPLLYQSGYVTIKDYNKQFKFYTLDIPNQEVRVGLTKALIPAYITTNTVLVNNTVRRMAQSLSKDNLNEMLCLLQQFLLTIPQCDNTHYEGHYQQMLYIIFSLLGMYVDVEVRTATGRVDIVMRTGNRLYIIELKINKSAEEAMKQIDLKDYPARFTLANLPITNVGINFDCNKHTIAEWKIEKDPIFESKSIIRE